MASTAERLAEVEAQLEELTKRLTLGLGIVPPQVGEKRRVVTVRMPLAMHTALVNEAHDRRASLNELCLVKLAGILPPDVAVKQAAAPAIQPREGQPVQLAAGTV